MSALTISVLSIFCYMNLYFIWSIREKNLGVVDIAWGKGFVIISFIFYWFSQKSPLHTIALVFVASWGLRLTYYLFKRNHGAPEDFRYQSLRKEWNDSQLQAYLKVFMFQGFLMFIISLPIQFLMRSSGEFNIVSFIGMAVWLFGFSWEVWADSSLSKFKSNPSNKGKLCTVGPWKYSRHPNYFGEITLWYGIFLTCFNSDYWWTLIGPVVIHFFIIKVSGIAFLKDRMKKYPDYAGYFAKTNALIPNFFIK